MRIKSVMIAAPKSGSGKTAVTCALLQVLKEHGLQAVSFKCGPDYIDPMFHEKILNIPSKNLDTFFTGEEKTKMLFADSAGKKDISVIEGVMGLYDGLGGVREEGSSYHLAKVTDTPIILVVDAKGMGRSIIPTIAGFLAYDREDLIKGVILNRVSREYYNTIRLLIEEELRIDVLGFLPEGEAFHIGSRHLGLILPDRVHHFKEKMKAAAKAFSQTVSVERIMEIAENAGDPPSAETEFTVAEEKKNETAAAVSEEQGTGASAESVLDRYAIIYGSADCDSRPAIAVARDEAFCFYYADNLRMLEAFGAEIKYFSPLSDKELPKQCHALLLGGGYPELYAAKLSRNRTMREAVRNAVANGMPVVAECGGFMYLHASLKDRNGVLYEMAGAIPAACYDTGKLVRFGYIALREKQGYFLPENGMIKGHEFHYYDSTDNGTDVAAVKPVTGKEYPCVIENEMQWMGFPHLYYPSNPAFARSIVKKALQFGGKLRKEGSKIE